MAKSMSFAFVTAVLAVELIFVISKLSGAGLVSSVHAKDMDLACAEVLSYPTSVRRQMSSRSGGPKVNKLFENCVKSVDGWRFKKSSLAPFASTSVANSKLPDKSMATRLNAGMAFPVERVIVPYPVHLMMLQLNRHLAKQQQNPSHEVLFDADSTEQLSARQLPQMALEGYPATLQPQLSQSLLTQLSGPPAHQRQSAKQESREQEQLPEQYLGYTS